MPVPAERTRVGLHPVGIAHTVQGKGVVVRPVLAGMCHLAVAGSLRAAGDPGEKLIEQIVDYLRCLLTSTAMMIVAPITARIASPSTISKGESNIITSLFFASSAPGAVRP